MLYLLLTMINRKLQIGVMGSAQDLKYSKDIENIAFEVDVEIAIREINNHYIDK